MSDELGDEIDDILSGVLEDTQSDSTEDVGQSVTFGQSVSEERQTNIVNDRIDWLGDELDVPDATRDLAKSLCDQYRDQRGDLVGTALELIAASCLYCAVKVTEVPLDPTDFVEADDTIVSRKGLLRRSKDIATTVGLDPSAFFESDQYVDRYCDELGVSEAVNERAHLIIDITEDGGLSSGKSPSGWAAAAVYNACLDVGEKRTQRELSDVANVTEVTIRNRYQEQREALRQIESLPSDPIDVVSHVVDASDVLPSTQELAELLIRNARTDGYPVDEQATLWGLAALRRASQLTDGDVKLKTLSQYTNEDSKEISTRTRKLRSVLSQNELQQFRYEQANYVQPQPQGNGTSSMSQTETKQLRDLNLPAVIETSTTDFIKEFYNPVLQCAAEYKRGVGFFTSGWLQFAAQGMAGLAENNGTAKWITSPNLEEDDWKAFQRGEEAKRNDILYESLQRSVDGIAEGLEEDTLNTLAWLIADDLLEIRFAMPDGDFAGDFHDKWGVITDVYGDRMAFHGSKNDSKQGFYNYESYDVFCEWESDREADRVQQHEDRFDLLWDDDEPGMEMYELPETIREDIVELREPDNRPYPEPDMSEKASAGLSEPEWIECRPYQKEAMQNWMKAGGKGILKMATGTGKTLTSLLAANELYGRQGERLGLIVAAPYQHLVEQWKDAMTDFNMDPILAYKSRSRWEDDFARAVTDFNWSANDTFSVITTHKTFSSDHFQNVLGRLDGDESLLILDEVHHMGATHYREQLPENIHNRLGLSATPERYYDDTGTEELFDYFGNGVVFEYGIRKAIDNGYLCEYYYIPHIIELTEDEEHRYLNLSERIGQLSHVVDGDIELTEDDRLKTLLIKRARLIGTAENKIERLKELIPQQDEIRHTLVYCGDGNVESDDVHEETQRHVDATVRTLGREMGLKVHPFTAKESQSERERLLDEFEEGVLQALVAIRCLDEGVDVPATETAYILASSTNPIQFVQRRGRILRQYEGKDKAVIHDFIVVPPRSINPNIMDDGQFNMERKLIEKELRRASVFAEDAMNHPDADIQGIPTSQGSLRKLKEDFNLLGL